jgi:hypothetical protein
LPVAIKARFKCKNREGKSKGIRDKLSQFE